MLIEVIVLILIPLIYTFLSLISSDRVLNRVVSSGSLVLFIYSLFLQIYYFMHGFTREVAEYGLQGIAEGIYGFIIDPLSLYIGPLIGIVSSLIIYYALDYMTPQNAYHPVLSGRQRYFAWMYFFVFSALLFVYSSTLLQLLIGFELMSLACWGLISYYGTSEAVKSSYKMLVTTHIGAYSGLAVLAGLVFIETNSFSLTGLSSLPSGYKAVILGLAMWAAITKSSQFPTYSWLPDAMVAPTPTSALLHGATMIEMGPYLVARTIMYMPDPSISLAPIVLVPIMFSLGLSALFYPGITDGKKLLAYSTIAEVGVMFFAVSLSLVDEALGLILYMFHFTVHAFLKSLGFLVMGYAGYAVGTHDLNKVSMLLSSNPYMYNTVFIVFYGLSGIPLYALSKIFILLNTGIVIGNIFYLAAVVILLFEATIFLLNTTRWFKPGKGIERITIPGRMKHSFMLHIILLYAYQAFFLYVMNNLVQGLGGLQ